MRTSALFGTKNLGFFEIYGMFAWTRGEGVEPVRTFCGQGGRRVNFLRFCADFYGRPLMPFPAIFQGRIYHMAVLKRTRSLNVKTFYRRMLFLPEKIKLDFR